MGTNDPPQVPPPPAFRPPPPYPAPYQGPPPPHQGPPPPDLLPPPPVQAVPSPPPLVPPSPQVGGPALHEPVDPTRAGPDVALTPVRQHARVVRTAPWGLLVLTLLAAAGVVLDANLVTVLLLVAAGLGLVASWALALSRPGPRVTITRGILEVRTFESHRVFDLTSPATRVHLHDYPGDPGWRVEIERRRLDPFVLDARTVDPHEFTAAMWPYLTTARGVPVLARY